MNNSFKIRGSYAKTKFNRLQATIKRANKVHNQRGGIRL